MEPGEVDLVGDGESTADEGLTLRAPAASLHDED
jgi:hypothetical protein